MKLFFEETKDVSFEQEMNEATGKSVYKISGIFSTIGEKNKNGRVYPRHIWEREVKEYQEVLANGSSNTLMELNHPPRANVEMMEAVAKITKLYIDGKYVMGEAILLNNDKANQLKSLIDAGIKMSVSSRGVGKVSATGMVENFKLSTYDIIPDQGQSDYNAQMMGIVEGVLEGKEFEILANGCVGECELPTVAEDVDNEFTNVTDLKAILEKVGAEVLCDLDKVTKEKVLKEFRETAVTESSEDYKAKYEELLENVAKYEAYVEKEFAELQEKAEPETKEELKVEVSEKTIEEKRALIREAFGLVAIEATQEEQEA